MVDYESMEDEASSRPTKIDCESSADESKNTNKTITNSGYENIPVLQNMNTIPSFVVRGTGRGLYSAPLGDHDIPTGEGG